VNDLDLAVVGNEDAFAAKLAEALGARMISNDRFLTWRLDAEEDHHVDLARARSEAYPAPGALPVVRPASSIDEDLARRDFTVNAMALRLTDHVLVDPFDGRADLDARLLRVLHDASFLDDPTRIFRAVRLAERCGLTIEASTSALLDEALEADALSTVSRERIWKEIDLATSEEEPVRIFRALDQRGCFGPVFGVRMTANFDDLPDNLKIPGHLDPRIVLTGVLLRHAPEHSFGRLPWDRLTNATVTTIATRTPSLATTLESAKDEEARFEACETASPEELFLAVAESTAAAEVASRFERAGAITTAIHGNELGAPPGPWIGRALRETKLALFAARVDENEAPSFASRLAMQYLND